MLDAIAAVFLGMTMSEEGRPRVLFTLCGVLMLGVLGNGLTQLNVDSYVRRPTRRCGSPPPGSGAKSHATLPSRRKMRASPAFSGG